MTDSRLAHMARGLLALGLLLLGLLSLAATARAQQPEAASYFPLEVGSHWRYSLTVEIEDVVSNAVDDRSIVQKVGYRDREAFLSQDRITLVEGGRGPAAAESNVVTTETLALEGQKVLVLAEQHAGASEHRYDPPRLFIDLARLEEVGAVWSWSSTDGRETLAGKVLENGPFVDKKGKIRHGVVVDLTSTYKGADGKTVAIQERKLWLVKGVGIFKEHVVVAPPSSHKTITDLELEPGGFTHDAAGAPAATASPTPGPK